LFDRLVDEDGSINPYIGAEDNVDFRIMAIQTPDLPNVILRVGVVNGMGRSQKIFADYNQTLDQYQLWNKTETLGYSSSKAPEGRIYMLEAVREKTPLKAKQFFACI